MSQNQQVQDFLRLSLSWWYLLKLFFCIFWLLTRGYFIISQKKWRPMHRRAFWCSLCPGDTWEARGSELGQSWLRIFSGEEKRPRAALRLSGCSTPDAVAPEVINLAREVRPKKSTERRSCILGRNCRQFECSQCHPAPAPFYDSWTSFPGENTYMLLVA